MAHTEDTAVSATPQHVGSLRIEASEPVKTLSRDDGMTVLMARSSVTITNEGTQVLVVEASATQRESQHQAITSLSDAATIAAGASWTLAAPPEGTEWTIVLVPKKAIQRIVWEAGLIGGVVVGLTLYGGYAIVRDGRRAWRHHRETSRRRR